MKQKHTTSLKFHTWFTLILAIASIVIILVIPDIGLFVALVFLALYVAGNGLLHAGHGTLTRDILIEYGLVAVVVLIVLVGALLG